METVSGDHEWRPSVETVSGDSQWRQLVETVSTRPVREKRQKSLPAFPWIFLESKQQENINCTFHILRI